MLILKNPEKKILILYYFRGEISFTVLCPCLHYGLSQPVTMPYCEVIQNCHLLQRLRT